jgi:hypothetical protein
LGVIVTEKTEWLDKRIEGTKKGTVNKVIECSSFWKREDGEKLSVAGNIMLEEILCEVYKKGTVFELKERINVI